MTLLLAVAGLAIVLTFLNSLLESAFQSISTAQIETLRLEEQSGARRLIKLHSHWDMLLGTLALMRAIVPVATSVWCGAYLVAIERSDAVIIFTVGFAMALYGVGGLVGRNLGVRYGMEIARRASWPMQWLIWITWPFAKIYAFLAPRLRGQRHLRAPTEDEIMLLTRLALESGRLRPQELRWVENALRLDQVRASELMTPRTVVYTLPADLPLSEVKHRSEHWTHSRLPLTEDRDPDQILGMVLRREVFDAIVKGKPNQKLRDLMHTIDFVPDTMRGHQLLDLFIVKKRHMVAVVDEYGSFEGVVTLEDVLECLLGSEIVDESDRHADMQQWARERALKARELVRKLTATAEPVEPEARP